MSFKINVTARMYPNTATTGALTLDRSIIECHTNWAMMASGISVEWHCINTGDCIIIKNRTSEYRKNKPLLYCFDIITDMKNSAISNWVSSVV